MKRLFTAPLADYLDGLTHCLSPLTTRRAIAAVLAFAASWWIYVPIHELLHAAGCALAGGRVTRLEISPVYGAAFLAEIFPFVRVGSNYAGQLTGFDTRGSDLIFLVTDFLPFAVTVFVGVPLLVAVRRFPPSTAACVLFGGALPLAFAPFISIPGDFYEMGSILVSRLAEGLGWAGARSRWRGDDVLRVATDLIADPASRWPDLAGVGLSLLLGTLFAFFTYSLGSAVASVYRFPKFRRPPLAPPPPAGS